MAVYENKFIPGRRYLRFAPAISLKSTPLLPFKVVSIVSILDIRSLLLTCRSLPPESLSIIVVLIDELICVSVVLEKRVDGRLLAIGQCEHLMLQDPLTVTL